MNVDGHNRKVTDAVCNPPTGARELLAEFAREAVLVMIGNTVIAAGITAAHVGKDFGENLVFSQAIGLSIMLLIQIGRFLLRRRNGMNGSRYAALVAISVVVGTVIGLAVARALLGSQANGAFAVRGLAMTGWIALVVTLLASWYGWSRAQIAGLREQVARTEMLKATSEKTALRARLQALQAQIEPHFLFNTLATLDSLIVSDPPRARQLLGNLNRFLRATLEASRAGRETLADQFAVLDAMLGVHAMRLGPRLAFSFDLPADCADVLVPPMLLQPLVENSLIHGIQPAEAGGRIEIRAQRENGDVELTVSDTGVGFAAKFFTEGSGIGIANVRDRLAALYGERASLTLVENAPQGVIARIRLPAETHENRAEEVTSR